MKISLSAAIDRPQLSDRVPSTRLVEWRLVDDGNHPAYRSPLQLCLAIDRSGSMSGEKLARARSAARMLIDRLSSEDRVGVVTFDHVAQVVHRPVPLTTANRASLKQGIDAICAGGSTCLSGGYLAAAIELSNGASGLLKRVLLLSDGQANDGITSIEELAHHARELHHRGVTTSTFGIGLGFNEELLDSMATAGGGQFRYIETPDEMEAAFELELSQLKATVAADVVFMLNAPPHCRLEFLGSSMATRTGRHFTMPIGTLTSGEPRSWFAELRAEPAPDGQQTTLSGQVTGRFLDGTPLFASADLVLRFVAHGSLQSYPLDTGVQGRAEGVRLAAASQAALRLERQGHGREAATYLRRLAAESASVSASDLTAAASLASRMEVGLSEVERKAEYFAAYERRSSTSRSEASPVPGTQVPPPEGRDRHD